VTGVERDMMVIREHLLPAPPADRRRAKLLRHA
jgi:hypothetical protein